jgi:hypothetical protein
MKNLISFISLVLFCFTSTQFFSQSPFNGISVQEVLIDESVIDIAADMEANMPTTDGLPGNVRCWRVYVCMDNPYWEVQVIYGDNTAPWSLSTTTSFYQSVNGGFLANDVNPGFIPFEPASEYDSWFTLGETYSSTSIFLPGSINPENGFEDGPQSGFMVDDIIGSSVFGAWPNGTSESTPDADNRVLIGQFTTDGIWSATMNFQFLRLNEDFTIYTPVTTVLVNGVTIDGTPGALPVICPGYLGCTDPSACNYDPIAEVDDGNCDLSGGCLDPTACNYEAASSCDDGSCTYAGCANISACNFNPLAGCDDGSCEFLTCRGCTSTCACNYNTSASIEDGSCEYTSCAGCTYPDATNYDPSKTVDDGSCFYDVTEGCPGDLNGDDEINTTDLLAFLSVFGTTCTP